LGTITLLGAITLRDVGYVPNYLMDPMPWKQVQVGNDYLIRSDSKAAEALDR